METIIEGLTEGQVGWWLLGAAAVVGAAKGSRLLAKGALKGYFAARDGVGRVVTGSRAGMRHLYEEAAADYQRSTTTRAAARSGSGGAAEPASSP
jgi:hypothetical protein